MEEIKHVQKGSQKMVRKVWTREKQKTTSVPKAEVQSQSVRTMRNTKLAKTSYMPNRSGRVPQLKKGH